MFVIHVSGNTYFQNDIKDTIDICLAEKIEDSEIGRISRYLNHAAFDSAYKSKNLSILCVTDEKARRLAGFFGCEAEYEKNYGQTA